MSHYPNKSLKRFQLHSNNKISHNIHVNRNFKGRTYIETLHQVAASNAMGKPVPTAFPTSAAILRLDMVDQVVWVAADIDMSDVWTSSRQSHGCRTTPVETQHVRAETPYFLTPANIKLQHQTIHLTNTTIYISTAAEFNSITATIKLYINMKSPNVMHTDTIA